MSYTKNEDEELQEKQTFMQKMIVVISITLFGVLGILSFVIVYYSYKDIKDDKSAMDTKLPALRDINWYAREGMERLGALGYEAANAGIKAVTG